MRPDFAKVVTESPRSGSGRKNRKTGLRLTANTYFDIHDDSPGREKMCRRNRAGRDDWKEFRDVLGPIRGFLRSRIGRLWDDVYSEIRAVISPNATEPIRHIWEVHMKSEVARNCFVSDGKICHFGSFGGGREEEVRGFYVDPKTQTLQYRELKKFRVHREPKFIGNGFQILGSKRVWEDGFYDSDTGDSFKGTLVIKIDHLTRAQKINGLWHLFFYRERSKEERIAKDFFGRATGTLPPLELVRQKQASKKELKKLGLKNDPPRF